MNHFDWIKYQNRTLMMEIPPISITGMAFI